MKINRKETFTIEDLSKEELLFFFEVVEKLQLAPDSTPEAHAAAKKFKEFRQETLGQIMPRPPMYPSQEEYFKAIVEEEEEDKVLVCEGCETTINVEEQFCPAEKDNRLLCPTCFIQRKHIADKING